MADRRGSNWNRSRSRSPVRKNPERNGIQERLKKISGMDQGTDEPIEKPTKIDREKVSQTDRF